MAKQRGIIKIEGTIGDLTFYKSQDGYLVREKGGVPAERISTDPAFQRTRENGAEFGRAGKAGKLLRTAFRAMLQNAADSKMVSRLTSEMVEVVQADTTSIRGERNVVDGDPVLLDGFEFNIDGKLGATLYAPYNTSIDRVAGTLEVTIDPYVPLNMIAAPVGATHFKIVSSGAEVDFVNGTYVQDSQSSAMIAWDATATAALTLSNTVTANSTLPLFLILGIEFYQQVNGVDYPLKNGAFNPLAIVKVSKV